MTITATCHTPDCQNDGVEIAVDVVTEDPETGEALPAPTFLCGPCGNPITDIEEGTT